MTNPTHTATAVTAGQEIVLFAKVGSQRFTLTANQLRDTVAAYLARGAHMPTPIDINGGDPNADEFQHYPKGKGQIALFGSGGRGKQARRSGR